MTTATHGRLALGTPWSRAITDEDRAAVEQRIPDGYSISVNAKASTAYWLLYLHGANGGRVISKPLRVSRGVPLEAACRFALSRWRETGVLA